MDKGKRLESRFWFFSGHSAVSVEVKHLYRVARWVQFDQQSAPVAKSHYTVVLAKYAVWIGDDYFV